MFDQQRMAVQADAESRHCLIPRLYSYPLIQAAYDQLVNTYSKGKESYPTVGKGLVYAEDWVKYAAGVVEPVVGQFDGQLVSVEKVACHYLDKLDSSYPAVKETPSELYGDLKDYYDSTRVKAGVDKALALKEFGVNKAITGYDYYNTRRDELVSGMKGGVDNAVQVTVARLHSLLDVAEGMLDKLAASTSEWADKEDKGSLSERVSAILGRAAAGVKDGSLVSTGYDNGVQMLQHLTDISIMLDYLKSQQDWAAETFSSAKSNAIVKLGEVKDAYKRFADRLVSIDEVSKTGQAFATTQLTRVRDYVFGAIEYLTNRINVALDTGDNHNDIQMQSFGESNRSTSSSSEEEYSEESDASQ